MSFLSPLWFLAYLGVIVYVWIARRREWQLQQGLLATIALLILALARPVVVQKPMNVEQKGSDVVLAVDLSYSMRATDIVPSRLEAAKRILTEIVRRDQIDRFGVIGFTTNAIVLSPLTKDKELLEHLFNGLDESQIMTKGTNIMSALELARKMSHAAHPVVILLTDGGDESSYANEEEFVRANDLSLSVVMLASREGSTLPGTEEGSVLKDDAGHIVLSARNDAIEEIVHQGKMIRGTDTAAVLDLINERRNEDFTGSTSLMRYQEWFYLPLGLALAVFISVFTTLGLKIRTRIIWLMALAGVSSQGGMIDFANLYFAKSNYDQGSFERSAELYARVDSIYARYNRANALYKAGKYQEALMLYHSIRTDRAAFKANIFYNMGNCHIRLQEFGEAREALLKSLSLRYTKAADQNLRAIAQTPEQQTLSVRKEKKDRFAAEENKPTGAKKSAKEGGGSNMKTDSASGGGGDEGKKVQSDPRLSMSQGKAKLSSRQYELINQRSIHETKPW